ncbi:MAG TPA: FAD:protein FMN transferase [Vicinamibacteria bacterium]|nr:FAD:protein FMN transferase [Vicinamibacteria bacterium]
MREREPAARVTVADEGRGPAARRFARSAMATVFEVHCVHPDAGYAGQAAQEAFAVLDRLERELSRFLPNSDISRISALRAGDSVGVSPSTMECLALARRMHAATAGAFDVSIGTGLERLELLEDELTVRAGSAGVSLDLGGIGKGYAVDRMAEVLVEWGVERALVHGGFSSVLALEAPPGHDGWSLSLSAPSADTPAVLARVSARRRAFSASGTRKGAHIRDPRTGLAVRRPAAWAALDVPPPDDGPAEAWTKDLARSPAALAESLSTAFMILDASSVADLCARHPEVEAWLLLERDARERAGGPAVVHFGRPNPAEPGADAPIPSWHQPPDRR